MGLGKGGFGIGEGGVEVVVGGVEAGELVGDFLLFGGESFGDGGDPGLLCWVGWVEVGFAELERPELGGFGLRVRAWAGADGVVVVDFAANVAKTIRRIGERRELVCMPDEVNVEGGHECGSRKVTQELEEAQVAVDGSRERCRCWDGEDAVDKSRDAELTEWTAPEVKETQGKMDLNIIGNVASSSKGATMWASEGVSSSSELRPGGHGDGIWSAGTRAVIRRAAIPREIHR